MVENARQLYHDGKLRECVLLLHKVQKIAPSDKIQRKIKRIEAYLDEKDAQSLGYMMNSPQKESIEISDGFSLPRILYEKLYPYQQDGVKWLWKLHNTAPGGVLADDMGLGKTVQVGVFQHYDCRYTNINCYYHFDYQLLSLNYYYFRYISLK